MMEAKYADLLEDIALQSYEAISARQAAGVNMVLNTYAATTSFDALLETFKGLAFELGSADSWRVVGIRKYEAPIPPRIWLR